MSSNLFKNCVLSTCTEVAQTSGSSEDNVPNNDVWEANLCLEIAPGIVVCAQKFYIPVKKLSVLCALGKQQAPQYPLDLKPLAILALSSGTSITIITGNSLSRVQFSCAFPSI